jgi:hypothetical protein
VPLVDHLNARRSGSSYSAGLFICAAAKKQKIFILPTLITFAMTRKTSETALPTTRTSVPRRLLLSTVFIYLSLAAYAQVPDQYGISEPDRSNTTLREKAKNADPDSTALPGPESLATDSARLEVVVDSNQVALPPAPKVLDTLARPYIGHWEVGLLMVFPLNEYHASDPTKPYWGNASQGWGFEVGRHLPFNQGQSPMGWYFSVGYFNNRNPGLNAVVDSFFARNPVEIEGFGELRYSTSFQRVPRYHVLPFSTGFSYQGQLGTNTQLYARTLLSATLSKLTNFTAKGTETLRVSEVVKSRWNLHTGHSLEIGLVFNEKLRLGVAWNYYGRADYTLTAQQIPEFSPSDWDNFTARGRVYTLNVKLAYTFGVHPPRNSSATAAAVN